MSNSTKKPVTIEKGVPIPKRASVGGAGRPPKYPLEALAIGDSFVVESKNHRLHKRAAALGIKLTSRKIDGVVRVWRVA